MKTINMDYVEYKADLVNATNKGYNRAKHTMIEAFELLNKGNQKDAFELLAEMLDYDFNDTIAKALNYDIPTPSFNESDVPF